MDIPENRRGGYSYIVLPGTMGGKKSNQKRLQDQVSDRRYTYPSDGAASNGRGILSVTNIQPQKAVRNMAERYF